MEVLYKSKYFDIVRYRCVIEVVGQSTTEFTNETTRKLFGKSSKTVSRVIEYMRILDKDDNTVRMLPITSLYKNVDSYIDPGLECTIYFLDSREEGGNCGVLAIVSNGRFADDINNFYHSIAAIKKHFRSVYLIMAVMLLLGLLTMFFFIGFVFLYLFFKSLKLTIKMHDVIRSLPPEKETVRIILDDVQKLYPDLKKNYGIAPA